MSQEINLYQPIFRREKTVFSASTMLILSLVFLAVFLLWGWATERRVDELAREVANREATEKRLTERIQSLQRTVESRQPDRELLERAEAAERKLRGLRASRAAVRQRIPERPLELSEPMRALGERHPDGLWLTAIELGDSGRRLTLEGRALEASLFPEYLERLQQSRQLEGVSLTDIAVRSSSGDDWPGVVFRVSSEPGDTP
ncbi:MAG: PilN domain-containing protein [Candidatus Wenzhouxiangella sp. M2_3B_020]